MKIFIAVDMEGISGIINSQQTDRGEISRIILDKLRNNSRYRYVFEIESKLHEKGIPQNEINELLCRKLADLILNMGRNMRVHDYWVYSSFSEIIKSIDFSKRFKSNERIYKIKVSLDDYDGLIYRIYEISANSYLSNFAYTILATFNTMAYHL